jgi:hypothetical protein
MAPQRAPNHVRWLWLRRMPRALRSVGAKLWKAFAPNCAPSGRLTRNEDDLVAKSRCGRHRASGAAAVNFSKLRIFLLALISAILASTSFASAQIVAPGSSTVHGAVAESEMCPAVLQGMLRARGSQVHVINAGVWGETTNATLAVPSLKGPRSSSLPSMAIMIRVSFRSVWRIPPRTSRPSRAS